MAVAAIVAGAASLASFATKRSQAKIERGQAEVAAKQQELQVLQREADRKDRLAASISSQNALAGAKGISAFEGSPLTILNDSMTREATATGRDQFSTSLNVLAMRGSARNRQVFSNIGANLSLLQSASSLASSGGGTGA